MAGVGSQMPASPSGPVSNQGFAPSSVWDSRTEAFVVIGAFGVAALLLLGWHGVGLKLDASAGG